MKYYRVTNLEKYNSVFDKKASKEMRQLYKDLKDREAIGLELLPDLCKLALREYIWLKIESELMVIHFGYDYYMYIGVEKFDKSLIKQFEEKGIFIESYQSPYA